MGRRYRRKNNSIISLVSDVVHIASQAPWWGALLTGFLAYIFIAIALGGFIESQLAAQKGSQYYPIIEARIGRIIHVCDWVGIACLLVGSFFAVRNYFFNQQAGNTEKGLITVLSKLLGRSLD